MTTPEF